MLAQLEQLIESLRRRLENMIEYIQRIQEVYEEVANRFLIREILRISAAVIAAAERFMNAIAGVARKLVDLLKSAAAPFFFLKVSDPWTAISQKAGKNASAMKLPESTLLMTWEGAAWQKYNIVLGHQHDAAKSLGATAGKIQDGAHSTGVAGVTFYGAILTAAASLVAEVTAEIAAAATGAGAIPAALAGCLTAVKCLTIWGTAVAALATFLLTQQGDTKSLRSNFQNSADFPGGAWPKALANAYSDG